MQRRGFRSPGRCSQLQDELLETVDFDILVLEEDDAAMGDEGREGVDEVGCIWGGEEGGELGVGRGEESPDVGGKRFVGIGCEWV